MNSILTIAKKEWQNYFTSPVGYVFAGLLMVVVYWLYFNDLFIVGQADLKAFWSILIFLMSIFIPAISMNLIAEEKKNSTWELILSLPIKEQELIMGKFVGCALYLLFTLLLSMPAMLTIFFLGRPDLGVVFGGFWGCLILGLAYLSTGLFFSTLSNQPIVAFLVTSVFLIFNNLISQDAVISRVPGMLGRIFEASSLSWRASNYANGIISLIDSIFLLSWIGAFLYASVLVLKNRDK